MQTDPTVRSARPADRPLRARLPDGRDSQHANPGQEIEGPSVFELDGERLGIVGLTVRETVSFAETDRAAAPAAIRQTSDFTERYPGDAVCMARELAGDGPPRPGAA